MDKVSLLQSGKGGGVTTLAEALGNAQADFPPITRTKQVDQGRFTHKYAPLEDVVHAVAPVLKKHGLAWTQVLDQTEAGQPALRTVLMHASGEVSGVFPLPVQPGMTAQQIGSVITYMRRYALVSILGLATEEDTDAVEHTQHKEVAARREIVAAKQTQEVSAAAGSSSPKEPAAAFVPPDMSNPAVKAQQAQKENRVPPADGGDPALVEVHFGKNKGTRLGDMTRKQQEWYARVWEPNPKFETEADRRLKLAAQGLVGELEIPF